MDRVKPGDGATCRECKTPAACHARAECLGPPVDTTDRSEWVLVPRKVDRSMLIAFWTDGDGTTPDEALLVEGDLAVLQREWDNLIAAAPPPPAEQASGDDELVEQIIDRVGRENSIDGMDGDSWDRLLVRAALSTQHPTGVGSEATRPVVDEAMVGRALAAFDLSGLVLSHYQQERRMRAALTAALAPQQKGD